MKKRDLIETVTRIAREAHGVPVNGNGGKIAADIDKLLRAATSLRRLALKMTQAPAVEERQNASYHHERKRTQIGKIAERLGVEVKFNDDDVSGFPVFVVLDSGASNDPSGNGWGIG